MTTEPWDIVARLRPRFAQRAAESDRTGAFPSADFDDLRGGRTLWPVRAAGVRRTRS